MKSLVPQVLSMSMLPGFAVAQANGLPSTLSDCLRVDTAVVGCVDELPAAAALEPLISFGTPLGTGVLPVLLPPSPGLIATLAGVVVLVEPGPPDPGAPMLFNNIPVSDLALSFQVPGGAGLGVIFMSDGHPSLPEWVSALNAMPAPPVTVLLETGSYQDVTPGLHTPYKVEIASDIVDVVPEPAGYAMLGLGLGLLAGWMRRQRR